MKRLFLPFLSLLLAFTAAAQRSPRVVDSAAALVAITPSASQPDVIVVSTNDNTLRQFRYYPAATDTTNATVAGALAVYGTSTGTGRWKELATPAEPFQLTASGLTLRVGAGILVDAAGVPIAVAGGNVTLRASATNFVVVDLFDLSFHSFTRAIHSGAVHVATVVTGTNSVSASTKPTSFALPPSGVAAVNDKLRNGQPVTALLLGDSITAGSGGTPKFYTLNFSTASGTTYNLPGVANITLTRRGLPGGNGSFALAMMADLFTQPPSVPGFGMDHVDQAIVRFPDVNAQLSSPESYIGPNPYAATPPDLVILALGTNNNSQNLEWIESAARFWRRKGCAVLLVTCNRRYEGPSSATITSALWKPIADACGAAVADTAEFVEEAYQNYLTAGGTSPYTDLVHPSASGQELWARAIAGCFTAYRQAPALQPLLAKRVAVGTTGIRSSPYAHLQLVHNITSGTTNSTTANSAENLRVLMAGTAASAGYLAVGVGNTVRSCFPYVSGQVFGIFENQSGDNFSYSVAQQGAVVIQTGTVTGASVYYQIWPIISAANVQAFKQSNSQYNSTANKGLPVSIGFRFTTTSGTAKLIGFLYETPYVEPVPLRAQDFLGSWALEAADFDISSSGAVTLGTDTTGGRLAFVSPECDAVAVQLRTGQSAGQFDVRVDGITAYSALEGYKAVSGTGLVLPLVVAPGAWPNYAAASAATANLANGARRHAVQVKLVGVNGSAAATSAGVRRLQVIRADALRFD